LANLSGGGETTMNTLQKCPDATEVLDSLKDFQKRSVERVFQRLYMDHDYTNRFLIADEVGLGKTLVARGVIAKSVEYLWDKVDRIDVIYICSNREIASQNINRLNITAEKQFSLASRMTLLPLTISDIKKQRLNFISFTPGTSFDLHSQAGIMLERALIYHILREGWNLHRAGAMNVFQDWASKESWRDLLYWFPKEHKVDKDLSQRFLSALEQRVQEDRAKGTIDIKERFFDLRDRFKIYKMPKHISKKDHQDVTSLIGEFRKILAQSCLEALEPDLVILDEFQRFKHLLEGQDQTSKLAQHLFNYKNQEMPTKIILLSATPYKMYTLAQEEGVEDHYRDFIRTIGFLYNSEEKLRLFEEKLRRFRNEIFTMSPRSLDRLKSIKGDIEKDLRKVMIRTERLAHTHDRRGMIAEKSKGFCTIDIRDIESFADMDRIATEIGSSDMVEYWKSAPYLLNLMDEYDFKRRIKNTINQGNMTPVLVNLLLTASAKMLRGETIKSYRPIIPTNPKLKRLIDNGIAQGSWKLLWVPPCLPYYKPVGVYNEKALQDYTKSIIFSCWQVVPKAIAMLCSYEAERRMVTSYKEARRDYFEERRSRRPLLTFTQKEGRLAGMANLTLLYPCRALAGMIDPLDIALKMLPKHGPPSLTRVRSEVRKKVEKLLDEVIGAKEKKGGRPDERWYWASLALMDKHFYGQEVETWISGKNNSGKWEDTIEVRGEGDADTFFKQHVRRFKDFYASPEQLGPRPGNLVDVLTKLALASPAVAALRSLLRLRDNEPLETAPHLMQCAARVGAGFRTLFNLPETITLLRGINDKEPYWERTLDYGISGNLQAVMDEYVHILKESLGLIGHPFDEVIRSIADVIYNAVSIRTIRMDFDDLKVYPDLNRAELNRHRIRCRYALRLGQERNEGVEEVTRSDQVRAAFNSPFRPFLLATTSIGQEGLDFHQYCHSIYHWNLPANPVDLEQREGRIHRYKGLVIRRNVAKQFGLNMLKDRKDNSDPWEFLFNLAAERRPIHEDDIIPFWIYEAKEGAKIERHVPCMPLSRDRHRLQELKRTLALYRMVFGQPRQEDLMEFLKKIMTEQELAEEIKDIRIDLSPR
jgi:hypothetical protein